MGKESQIGCSIGSLSKIDLEQLAQVAGNVAAGGEIRLKKDSRIHGNATAAGAVSLDQGANVSGSISQNSGVSPWASASLFTPAAFSTGGPDVKVEKNQSLTLSPGSYGKLDVKADAFLTLAAGDYSFQKLDLDKNVQLNITGPTVIRVVDDVKIQDQGRIQGTATDLLVISGKNVDLHKNGVYVGSFMAPNGTVKLHHGSQFSGLLYGQRVDVDQNSTVSGAAAIGLIVQVQNGQRSAQAEEQSFSLFVPVISGR